MKEGTVGPEDQRRKGSGCKEGGVQSCLNCAAQAELAARQGGSGALRAMELPAQPPELTKQASGAGLRRRGNTGTSCESQAPTCSALPGANSQGQDGLPGACCREACSLVWGLLHLGFWRGTEADLWCLRVQRRCDRVAAAGQRQLAPAASTAALVSLGLGSCQKSLLQGQSVSTKHS